VIVVWSLADMGIHLSVLIIFFPFCLKTLFHFKNRQIFWRILYHKPLGNLEFISECVEKQLNYISLNKRKISYIVGTNVTILLSI
jgi:hypothetical protein